MPLQTRINGASEDNNSISIELDGVVLATFKVTDNKRANLEIETADGVIVSKPNGWKSK